MDNFAEEYYQEPQNDEAKRKEEEAFLDRYYKDILSSLISAGQEAGYGAAEIVPYEVTVFSDQPGILYAK